MSTRTAAQTLTGNCPFAHMLQPFFSVQRENKTWQTIRIFKSSDISCISSRMKGAAMVKSS